MQNYTKLFIKPFLVDIVGRDYKMLFRNFQLLSKLWTRSSTDTL